MNDLTYLTPTICSLFGIKPPILATQNPLTIFDDYVGRVQRALLYCPDAFGVHAIKEYPDLANRINRVSTHNLENSAVFPPVTPVCYASIFTGALPARHGITKYERPVLKCDTLFDAFLRAGKKVAIIAVKDCSVDLIFREREIDYFSEIHDMMVMARALKLLEDDQHDLIVVYNQEYDDLLHETQPFSDLAKSALYRHVEQWELLVKSIQKKWDRNYIAAFLPDHGAHIDPANGFGTHGDDIAEDMLVKHYFVVR